MVWSSPMLWALIAVAVFWALGAYNRLMRLRSAAIQAFGGLDVHLVRWIALLGEWEASHAAGSDGRGVDAERDPAAALQAATNQLGASLAVARARPLQSQAQADLSSTCRDVMAHWQALSDRISVEGDAQLREQCLAWQIRWDDALAQTGQAVGVFSAAVDQYNQAILQFPARLMARAFGFKAVQPMSLQPHPKS